VRLAPVRDALVRAAATRLERSQARLAALAPSLVHLDPHAVLDRGYALVTTADGTLIHDAAQLAIGDGVTLALARGAAGATITRIEPSG
jgi:exodeoxyribonuclease VII large subunit